MNSASSEKRGNENMTKHKYENDIPPENVDLQKDLFLTFRL
jgi:hypothetical protein